MRSRRPTSPAQLAEWRAEILDDLVFWDHLMPSLSAANKDFNHPHTLWASLRDAALWWVGSECCELVSSAAPAMPPVTLTPDLVPDIDGFAFFETPITGQDARDPDVRFEFDCLHWQPLIVPGNIACVAIVTWTTAKTSDMADRFVAPVPLGRSDWPYGFDTDEQLPRVPAQAHASIVEDRQLLAALWQLTSQPELVETTKARTGRPAARRITRRGYEPRPIRVVNLNRTTTSRRGERETADRRYTHQWVVRGHWRQQPYGPGRSLRRARWIDTHVRGPEDKPLRVRDTVKVWTKPQT